MVATRDERREKLTRVRDGEGRYVVPPRPRVTRAPQPDIITSVNLFDVSTLTNGETIAFPADMSASPQIEFRFPGGVSTDEAHLLAVRFLRRRGPNYMPARVRLVITLDGRGRQRVIEGQ